ncbi:MAG: putative ATP-dependent endonuclease of OLD family [Rheinheimera aquimaris]|jgi:predicted ATP-dependent endonuclease of OLD family|uniref:ATP-dependent nuclease n=1 Tax=Rheinheimera aquimaris TaxID=412437 RepID=UPI0039E28F4B
MKLVYFSVTNYRSITAAHQISLHQTTILIGQNNEGKSNILKALDTSMTILQNHSNNIRRRHSYLVRRKDENSYCWDRDFPITLQNRKSGLQTIFKLEFTLNDEDIELFREEIKSKINGSLSLEIKIGKDDEPSIRVLEKRGKGGKTLNSKSEKIALFIARNIVFNYIPAVRTDTEAMDVVRQMLSIRMKSLEKHAEYQGALETIRKIQEPVLKELSDKIKSPLQEFLPSVKNVTIEIPEDSRRISMRSDFEIIVDDGTPTSLAYKGDGVKSLAALSLLKGRVSTSGASIIAIEEPESHLHPAAIHQLNSVITSLGNDNQVVLTTHNPLFVDRNDIKSNIIVNSGKATPAKSTKQIRDILGIKASDNLTNASYVLVVEGEEDVIALKAILPNLSEIIARSLRNNLFVIEPIGGAGNLPYKLTLLNNSLCVYHCLLDNDEAGRTAFEKAEKDKLLSIKNNTFVTCNGSSNSEFEDCLNVAVYSDEVLNEFGVDLTTNAFKGNRKWSDRVRDVFLTEGKLWNDKVESQVKYTVANAVRKSPATALNIHKRNSIDALVRSLESMLDS